MCHAQISNLPKQDPTSQDSGHALSSRGAQNLDGTQSSRDAHSSCASLADALQIRPGVTSFIGGGGKTTIMKTLALELLASTTASKILLSTSTHMFPYEEFPLIADGAVNASAEDSTPKSVENSATEFAAAISAQLAKTPIAVTGTMNTSGKLTAPPVSFSNLAKLCEYLFIEADGSKGLPFKAHRANEPVIDAASVRTVYLVGASGFGKPMRDVCHRPELYSALLAPFANRRSGNPAETSSDALSGIPAETSSALREDLCDIVTPEFAAQAVNTEHLADIVFINQCENEETFALAARFAAVCKLPVVAGSLWNQTYRVL